MYARQPDSTRARDVFGQDQLSGFKPHATRLSHPLHRTGISPAEQSAVADPAADRRLFLESLHVLRNVRGAAATLPRPGRKRGTREHRSLRRPVRRARAPRVPRRWRCAGAVDTPAAEYPRSHPRPPALGAPHLELLPGAQPAQKISGRTEGAGRSGACARLRRRGIRR